MTFEQTARDRIGWESEPTLCPVENRGVDGAVIVRRGQFVCGASAGVEVVLLDTGAVRVIVLPTRGMGIWRVEAGESLFGWDSPVQGPVHPSLVPVFDPSGLGWLEGFDELLVRCGLESNGAAQHDERGNLEFPLHGRIANLPARDLKVTFDPATSRLTLEGIVTESRLFFKRLTLRSRITVTANLATIEIEDTVTNELAVPATAQLLYHINLGSPLLAEGSRVCIRGNQVMGKDELSRSEGDHWNQMGPPQAGYSERVYFIEPVADEHHQSAAMLRSGDAAQGFGITFDVRALPHLILWKNTAATPDGYVVGLEPATNLPKTRREETAAGRVVSLDGGESATFRVTLHPFVSAGQVEDFAARHRLD